MTCNANHSMRLGTTKWMFLVMFAVLGMASFAFGAEGLMVQYDFADGFQLAVSSVTQETQTGNTVALSSGGALSFWTGAPGIAQGIFRSGVNCVPDGRVSKHMNLWGVSAPYDVPDTPLDDPFLLYLPDGYYELWLQEIEGPSYCEQGAQHTLHAFVGNGTVLNTAPATGEAVTVVYPDYSNPRWTDTENPWPFHDSTVKSADPAQAVPFIAWAEGPQPPNYQSSPTDIWHFVANIGDYTEPVDVYLGLSIPGFSGELFLFGEDGGLHAFSTEGLVKFRDSVRSVKTEVMMLTNEVITPIQQSYGKIYFYTLVTPAGRLDGYHLWAFEL